ncbi:MAG: hypothetical protein ABFD16_05395 [Thermoguttaceae bacterium]
MKVLLPSRRELATIGAQFSWASELVDQSFGEMPGAEDCQVGL